EASSAWLRVRSTSRGTTRSSSVARLTGSAGGDPCPVSSLTASSMVPRSGPPKAGACAVGPRLLLRRLLEALLHDRDRRARVVALGAHEPAQPPELARVHDHEAGRAGELLGRLGGDALGGVGVGPILGLVLVIVVAGRDAVLEDRVEVRLDVVGVEVLVVVIVVVGSGRLAAGCRDVDLLLVLLDHGRLGRTIVGRQDVLVELVVDEVL